MFKVFDSDYNFLQLITECGDPCVTEELAKGFKTLSFKAPVNPTYLSLLIEENYVTTADYNYVIKELELDGNDFFKVYCSPDIETIKGTIWHYFDCFQKNIEQAYQYAVQGTNWSVSYHSSRKDQITYQLSNTTSYEMIETIAEDCEQELWYDTKNKILHVYDKMGQDLGAYYSNQLKLERLKQQSNSYDYATVLYPIGKDGLTIGSVNNGRDFLDNYTYTDKYIAKFWIQEDIEIAERLKGAAQDYLDIISQPRVSYKIALTDLGEDIQIGDGVMVVDNIKKIKQKLRVVKIIRYLEQPELSSVEVSSLREDFARTFIKNQRQTEKEIAYIKSVLKTLQ